MKYGRGIVKDVRNLEKMIIRLIKTKCDHEFLQLEYDRKSKEWLKQQSQTMITLESLKNKINSI